MGGQGRQGNGALVNMIAFYFIAIPLAVGLGFGTQLGVTGLYLGLLTGKCHVSLGVGWAMCSRSAAHAPPGPIVQLAMYSVLLVKTDWPKQAAAAKKRLEAAGAGRRQHEQHPAASSGPPAEKGGADGNDQDV